MFARLKAWVAKFAIALVVFTQLAGAGYACAVESDAYTPALEQHEHSAMSGGCDEMDPGNPNLCRQHCQVGTQSVGSDFSFPLPAPGMTLWLVVKPVDPAPAAGVIVLPILLKRTTAPPAAIRFQVFRI